MATSIGDAVEKHRQRWWCWPSKSLAMTRLERTRKERDLKRREGQTGKYRR